MSAQPNKTKREKRSAKEYIASLSPEEQKTAKQLLKVFRDATDMKPAMCGEYATGGVFDC